MSVGFREGIRRAAPYSLPIMAVFLAPTVTHRAENLTEDATPSTVRVAASALGIEVDRLLVFNGLPASHRIHVAVNANPWPIDYEIEDGPSGVHPVEVLDWPIEERAAEVRPTSNDWFASWQSF